MDYLLTGAEMSACDAAASNVMGIPSLVLMERAAAASIERTGLDGIDVLRNAQHRELRAALERASSDALQAPGKSFSREQFCCAGKYTEPFRR